MTERVVEHAKGSTTARTRWARALTLGLPLLVLGHAADARATGGMFVTANETSHVAEHRVLLSISPQSTTLIDQIVFTGAPASFAWVLPIKGVPQVGLSSDALFENLDQATHLAISPPPLPCCGTGGGGGAGGGGSTALPAAKQVGPYETVQLPSDPAVLEAWLTAPGYVVPASVGPIIDAFAAAGYGFLAIRFVPGAGDQATKPIRITTSGPMPSIPIRIAAAGAPDPMPTRLWIVADQRYAITNAPAIDIPPASVVWNWDTSSSNHASLEKAALAASGGKGWVTETSTPFASAAFQTLLTNLATTMPAQSGYYDLASCQQDLSAIFGSQNPASTWVTRMYAELGAAGLASDLTAGVSADPSPVPTQLTVAPGSTMGTPPQCPMPCGTGGGGGTGGTGTGGTGTGGTGTGGTGTGGTGTGGTGASSSSSTTTGSGDACTPGQQVACACPGGAKGAQVCSADGSGFGMCQGCAGAGGGGGAAGGSSGGCGCAMAGAAETATDMGWLLALAGAVLARRRGREGRGSLARR